MLSFMTPTGTIDGDFTASSLGAEVINWTSGNALTANALAQVAMFTGSALQVKVGTFTTSAAVNGSVAVTLPFLADLVLIHSAQSTSSGTMIANQLYCTGAAVVLSGVVTQGSVAHVNAAGAASNVVTQVDNRYACVITTQTATLQALELSAFTASGFTATTRLGTPSAMLVGYMAFHFGGTKVPFLQQINSPTATGVATTTIPGITPEFALLLMSTAQTVNAIENDADANGFAMGMFTATQSGTVGVVAQDAANPSDVESFVDASAARLQTLVGTTSHKATVPVGGMAAETLSLEYSVATSPARKWILVGWGSAPAGTVTAIRKRYFAW